ncbi:uncharacterized protein KQ657_002800 [Scheffersomyces spartinae]|uniref:Nitrogen regulatory protein areA GATA-like domain-containing protein n=1 Tax=Scheffersomyces spartinae TaxID=45513 RepID=A0A9P8AH69_9ASCO|nr:uncharacterized protein KQ657_002800 [Scheffersomyces spartinae]KAG7191832.1 hypothetical protein KQ657_002800 [Scheffersomyces spartinae]
MRYAHDDLLMNSQATSPIRENVDYMSPCEPHLENDLNLYMCWKLHSVDDSCYQDQRLANISWRRWSKNLYHLKCLHPYEINWFKEYDITWLYGPKFTHPYYESDFFTSSSHPKNTNDNNYTTTVRPINIPKRESVSSESSVFSYLSSCSSSSSLDCYRKPNLKKESNSPFAAQCGDTPRKKKKVSFNYIINSREIINGISVDYDFLDEKVMA